MKGWGGIASNPVTLIKVPEIISEKIEEKIETEIIERILPMSDEDVSQRISDLEGDLSLIEPTYPIKHKVDVVSASYPRNRELEVLLKKLNHYICQYCSESGFEKESGGLYIECHHMIPMSMGEEYGTNPDVPSNILVLCSWCHKKLDRGTIEVKRQIYTELVEKDIITKEKFMELEKFHVI